jgi:hypothetical protein
MESADWSVRAPCVVYRCTKNTLLIDMRRQRQLDNDAVNRRVVTNGLNTRTEGVLGDVGTDAFETTFNATFKVEMLEIAQYSPHSR